MGILENIDLFFVGVFALEMILRATGCCVSMQGFLHSPVFGIPILLGILRRQANVWSVENVALKLIYVNLINFREISEALPSKESNLDIP